MLSPIKNLPSHVFGVKARGEVTEADFKSVMLPGLADQADRTNQLYFLFHLETKLQDFTFGAWMQDALAGLKHLTQWKKMAFVTDQKGVEKFMDYYTHLVPGEAKGFPLDQLDDAIKWVSEKNPD